jgi:hypothetical protein
MVPRAYAIIGTATATVVTAVLAASITHTSLLGAHPAARGVSGIVTKGDPEMRPVRDQGLVHISPTVAVVITTVLLAIFGLTLLYFLLRTLWTQSPAHEVPATHEELEPGSRSWAAGVTVELHDEAQEQLAVLHEGAPRNAIVACWMGLQAATLRAGMPTIVSETAEEYLLRAIRSLSLDPAAMGELAGLYREARFSEHVVDETQRQRAAAALRVLADQLATRRAGIGARSAGARLQESSR